MKKIVSIFVSICFIFSIFIFAEKNINNYSSAIETKKYYKLIADHADEYAFISYNYLKLTILDDEFNVLTEDYDEVVVNLQTNQEVYLIIEQNIYLSFS